MCHARFAEYGLALDVPISYVDVGEGKTLPMVRPTDMFQYLADIGKLGILFGSHSAADLEEFWRRFRAIEPNNSVFADLDSGRLTASRLIPCVCHGDEGRGKKKRQS